MPLPGGNGVKVLSTGSVAPVLSGRELRRAFQADKKWIWHNGKYDQKVLWRALNLPRRMLGRPGWDTMLAEHILEEAKPEEYGLKPLVKRFFPALSGYEDQLQAAIESQDGALNAVVEGPELLPAPRTRIGMGGVR